MVPFVVIEVHFRFAIASPIGPVLRIFNQFDYESAAVGQGHVFLGLEAVR